MSWDELFRFRGGDAKLSYYEAILNGEERPQLADTYPGLFDLPLAIFRRSFSGGDLVKATEQGHVWSLFFGLVGIFATWRLAALLGGERAGFWALVFLATMPRYYGHMFFNPKDIPFAATYMLALLALAHVLKQLPKFPSWRSVLWVGLTAGLALSTRMAGLLILFYFAILISSFLVGKYFHLLKREREIHFKKLGQDLLAWAKRGALAGAIAYLILLIFWPAGHVNPFSSLSGAVGSAQSFGWSGLVLMDGHLWKAQDLPSYYMIYWLLVALPEHIVVLLALSGIAFLLAFWLTLKNRNAPVSMFFWPRVLLALACVFPLTYMLIKQPVLYDGLRHFLFLLPVFACAAALALEWLLRKISRKRMNAMIQGVLVILSLLLAAEMTALHPYQYIYFNSFSGGLPAALNRDETDYWGVTHREAALWLNEYIEQTDSKGTRPKKVYMSYTPWMLDTYLNKRFEITHKIEEGDFAVAITRMNFHKPLMQFAEILHVVERRNVPLCYIFKIPDDIRFVDASEAPPK
ncbi:MAG: glycosyltransferase family 39 protein [Verrucomicrobiota bacterium]